MLAIRNNQSLSYCRCMHGTGPFTMLCLEVTVVSDVAVIFLFSLQMLIAYSTFENHGMANSLCIIPLILWLNSLSLQQHALTHSILQCTGRFGLVPVRPLHSASAHLRGGRGCAGLPVTSARVGLAASLQTFHRCSQGRIMFTSEYVEMKLLIPQHVVSLDTTEINRLSASWLVCLHWSGRLLAGAV